MKTVHSFFLRTSPAAVAVIVLLGLASCKGAEAKVPTTAAEGKRERPLTSFMDVNKDATEKPSCCKGIPSRQKMCVKK